MLDRLARLQGAGERDEDVFQPQDETPEPDILPTASTGIAAPVTDQPEEPQDG
jgi:hypothetical protein